MPFLGKIMINKGDKVKIEYIGKLKDGTVFDQSNDQPLEFEVGAGHVIPGFDTAVEGMNVDDEKDFVIEPKEAYGERNEDLKKKIPKSQIPDSDKIQKGMQLAIQTPEGQKVPVMVSDVDDEHVTIDVNHPLAGKELHFHIKILA